MGTLGGNLCLDTRCNYYDQRYEWRKAIDFCMKKDGDRCWVATSSPTCLAVSSTDTAPALIALGAPVSLVSSAGTRQLAVADLYVNDGMHYLTRRPDEILTAVHVPDTTRLAEHVLEAAPARIVRLPGAGRRGRRAARRATARSRQARIVLGAVVVAAARRGPRRREL